MKINAEYDASTAIVFSNVEQPENWARGKYFYADGEWVLNQAWIPYHETL